MHKKERKLAQSASALSAAGSKKDNYEAAMKETEVQKPIPLEVDKILGVPYDLS
jgi:hypothetical protein